MKLLITGYWKPSVEQINKLKDMGHDVICMQKETDDIPCPPEEIEAIIANVFFLYHSIEQFTSLKYIQLNSAGFDRVPMDYVKAHNIEIHNAKDVYSIPIAEYAICGVLQLYKQSRFFHEKQKNHEWKKNKNLIELNNKRVLIIGCGSIGRECAKRFKAFGCTVIGLNRSERNYENFDKILPLTNLKKECADADVIVVAIPITDETKHLINKEILSSLKPTAVLVNVARGAIIDEQALIDTIPNIAGAVIDVFSEEPLSKESRLWDMDNVIISPHNSFFSDGVEERMSRVTLENLKNIQC